MLQGVKKTMVSIRQKINQLRKSKEDKTFEKYGIVSEFGNPTEEGRRVILDKMWQSDPELRSAVLADLEALEVEEKKSK